MEPYPWDGFQHLVGLSSPYCGYNRIWTCLFCFHPICSSASPFSSKSCCNLSSFTTGNSHEAERLFSGAFCFTDMSVAESESILDQRHGTVEEPAPDALILNQIHQEYLHGGSCTGIPPGYLFAQQKEMRPDVWKKRWVWANVSQDNLSISSKVFISRHEGEPEKVREISQGCWEDPIGLSS